MNKQKITIIIISIVAVVAIGLGGYFYYQLKHIKIDPQIAAKEEISTLISKVSKLYLLPTGEEPTIATVSDPEALKNQSFFFSSEKGDKVLIYAKAGKAILYRPSIDKIIETAPINDNTQVSKDTPVSSTPINPTPQKIVTKTQTKK